MKFEETQEYINKKQSRRNRGKKREKLNNETEIKIQRIFKSKI